MLGAIALVVLVFAAMAGYVALYACCGDLVDSTPLGRFVGRGMDVLFDRCVRSCCVSRCCLASSRRPSRRSHSVASLSACCLAVRVAIRRAGARTTPRRMTPGEVRWKGAVFVAVQMLVDSLFLMFASNLLKALACQPSSGADVCAHALSVTLSFFVWDRGRPVLSCNRTADRGPGFDSLLGAEDPSVQVLIAAPSLRCWVSLHRFYALAAVLLLLVFVPAASILNVMINEQLLETSPDDPLRWLLLLQLDASFRSRFLL